MLSLLNIHSLINSLPKRLWDDVNQKAEQLIHTVGASLVHGALCEHLTFQHKHHSLCFIYVSQLLKALHMHILASLKTN